MSNIKIRSIDEIDLPNSNSRYYTVISYQYLYGSCGYFYLVKMTKHNDSSDNIYEVNITHGNLFDK